MEMTSALCRRRSKRETTQAALGKASQRIRGQALLSPTPAILRPMSRPLRIEFPGAVYQVTSRGDRHERIFENHSDSAALLGVLEDMHRFDAQVLAYCLIGNHSRLTEAKVFSRLRNGSAEKRWRNLDLHGISGYVRREDPEAFPPLFRPFLGLIL